MLEAVKRAYDKNAITEENQCPVGLETIETYLQILAPAYRVSVGLQKTSSTIADIIPSVQGMIRSWKTFVLSGDPKRLCRLLIITTENKFKEELESNIHKVR